MEIVNNINDSEKALHRRIIRYSANYHFTSNNSVHVSITFPKGSTPYQQDQAWEKFLNKVFEVAGISKSKVAAIGWRFSLNDKGYAWPHGHGIVYSTKDRRSGKTIGRLSRVEHEALENYWKSETGQTLKIRRVYDSETLLAYIGGESNLDVSPEQTVDQLPSHNRELFKTKMVLKAAA